MKWHLPACVTGPPGNETPRASMGVSLWTVKDKGAVGKGTWGRAPGPDGLEHSGLCKGPALAWRASVPSLGGRWCGHSVLWGAGLGSQWPWELLAASLCGARGAVPMSYRGRCGAAGRHTEPETPDGNGHLPPQPLPLSPLRRVWIQSALSLEGD